MALPEALEALVILLDNGEETGTTPGTAAMVQVGHSVEAATQVVLLPGLLMQVMQQMVMGLAVGAQAGHMAPQLRPARPAQTERQVTL